MHQRIITKLHDMTLKSNFTFMQVIDILNFRRKKKKENAGIIIFLV